MTTPRTRLRNATADLHVLIDEQIARSNPFADVSNYRTFLHAHWRARHHVVAEFGGLAPEGPWHQLALEVQRRLERDLWRLGVPVPATRPRPLPRGPHALGVLYVLEGSLVGGQMLARAATDSLGAHAPLDFLSSGALPAGRWAHAVQLINDQAVDHPDESLLSAAREVFMIVHQAFAVVPEQSSDEIGSPVFGPPTKTRRSSHRPPGTTG